MQTRWTTWVVCAFALGLAGAARADVTVPAMFSDHAVLQRNVSVPVWRAASPGEAVTVDCDADCGLPPLTEAVCDDGVDEDCDGGADCSDPTGECDADPACDCLPKQASCSDDAECCSNKCRGGKCR